MPPCCALAPAPEAWDAFVQASWPEFTAVFPTQSTVVKELGSEFLFTGPFASYAIQADGGA